MKDIISRIKQNKKDNIETDPAQIHHDLMCIYGFISLEELKQIPIRNLIKLHNKVKKEIKLNNAVRFASLTDHKFRKDNLKWLIS